MAKYRVHIECSKTLPNNSVYSQCLYYIVSAATEDIARAKAVEMAKQHYVEYDSFQPYHVEKVQKGEYNA